MKKGAIITLVLVGLIGLVDASFLTAQHYRGGEVVCEIGGHSLGNCGAVTNSQYATVGSIPVALAGAVYYFVVFALAASLLTTNSVKILRLIAVITGLGFLATLYFVYLQLFVLNAICVYCMVSALSTTILFITSIVSLSRAKANDHTFSA